MPRPVDHLSEPNHQLDVPFGSADQGLTRRLRDPPPNHPSADPDARRPGGAGADGERPAKGDAEPEGEPALSPPLWNHVDQLREMWADHVQRWPESRRRDSDGTDGQRPDDPPGAWRGKGDQFLSPEANAQADEVIESLQKVEPVVTVLLRAVENENKHGGVLVGLDYRRKGADRIKEKIADKIDFGLGNSPAEVAGEIRDAVRYTFCFEVEDYVSGHDDVVARLVAAGYTRTHSKNCWLDGQPYRGINSQWRTADGGRFELQFHTRESLYAKETLTHPAYERLRSPDTRWEERRELEAFQWRVSGAVSEPIGVDQIADQERRA